MPSVQVKKYVKRQIARREAALLGAINAVLKQTSIPGRISVSHKVSTSWHRQGDPFFGGSNEKAYCTCTIAGSVKRIPRPFSRKLILRFSYTFKEKDITNEIVPSGRVVLNIYEPDEYLKEQIKGAIHNHREYWEIFCKGVNHIDY